MILAELSVPAPCKLMNSNDRPHPQAKAKLTRAWRLAGAVAAAGETRPDLPKPVQIIAYVWKPINNRYDPGNLYPTAKAIVDGVVDAKWLPDDDRHHVEGPDMRHGGIGPARIVLHFVNV